MAAGLMKLLEDNQLRRSISTEGKKLAEQKYGQAQYLSKLEKVYRTFQNDTSEESSMNRKSDKG